MNLSCIHCGNQFSVTADQLGGRGRCPHCRGEIQLPRAEEEHPPEEHVGGSNWVENWASALGSAAVHMILFLLLLGIQWGKTGLPGDGEDVMIGMELPTEVLSDTQDEKMQVEDKKPKKDESEPLDELVNELAPPTASASTEPTINPLEIAVSPSGGGSTSFDVNISTGGGSMAGSGDWDGMIGRLRRDGLDIVIAFDSTGSMSGEINQVKAQIGRIGTTLFKLVPSTRISLCTYRDEGDEYVVKGLPLTGELQQIQSYLDGIHAGGGGDEPEAVQEGIRWSIANNQFRSRARKVILIFGDARPHQEHKKTCLELASDFKTQNRGVVSTVTCRQGDRIPDFVDIAQMGGGEAFLTSNEREIMTQLMVLVFGSQFRSKVIEAFKLLDG